jgi:Fe-S oxidoreductase
MFPDRKYNVMSMFRELNGIHYQDLNPNQECPAAFFPGCTMLTYSPELTRTLHSELKNGYKEVSLITDCCGMPLAQLGLQSRCEDYITFVLGKLLTLQVKELVVACPNCYYQLRPLLKDVGIKIVTIYEALKDSPLINRPLVKNRTISVTIHDSCPDRFHNLFASQSREALLKKGYTIVEMKRSHDKTVCCGSGGQVTHFQPELAQNVVLSRLEEAENTEADILTAYCLGCILNFSKIPGKIQVQHVLNLLLGLKQDFSGLKAKAKVLFTGPKGEEYWQRIMADE